jgi:hypothetical protein
MNNRILHVEIRDHSVIPAQAEVHVAVVPERRTPATEVRGRLMGPHCLYASTVEVAYPLRPLPRPGPGGPPERLTLRAIIPEASLWEPESPFLYRGPVELWQDGRRCDEATLTHGLRALALGPRGLRLNGRPLALHGRVLTACPDFQDALAWHRAGCNLLLAPVGEATAPLWDLADRVGFLVLGRLPDTTAGTLLLLAALGTHPCCLGWLAGPDTTLPAPLRTPALSGASRGPAAALPVGLELGEAPPGPLPPGFSFGAGTASAVKKRAGRADLALPLLLLGTEEEHATARVWAADLPLLGWAG